LRLLLHRPDDIFACVGDAAASTENEKGNEQNTQEDADTFCVHCWTPWLDKVYLLEYCTKIALAEFWN
jgi:hypothetical protein